MLNFKIYGLADQSVETMRVKERVLGVICHVVRQLRLEDDHVITLSSDQVIQAFPGLPPGKPYLELRSDDVMEMTRAVMALEADGWLGIYIEMQMLDGVKSAKQMSRQLDDDGGDEEDALNGPEEGSSLSGAGEFDF